MPGLVGFPGFGSFPAPEEDRDQNERFRMGSFGATNGPTWPWVKIQIVPPVNIPLPTKIGSKMGGEFTNQPKWDPIGFDNHSQISGNQKVRSSRFASSEEVEQGTPFKTSAFTDLGFLQAKGSHILLTNPLFLLVSRERPSGWG